MGEDICDAHVELKLSVALEHSQWHGKRKHVKLYRNDEFEHSGLWLVGKSQTNHMPNITKYAKEEKT